MAADMDAEQQQQAQEFEQARTAGREAAQSDRRTGRYDPTTAAARYREANGIPAGLDLHADFASARAGFIQGYRSLEAEG